MEGMQCSNKLELYKNLQNCTEKRHNLMVCLVIVGRTLSRFCHKIHLKKRLED